MTTRINELKKYPNWIDTLTKEQQYAWYVSIKKSLSQWQELGDITELELAIKEYEIKNNIV
jgi:hypothetical protein